MKFHFLSILYIAGLFMSLSCSQKSSEGSKPEDRKAQIEILERKPSEEGIARRSKSIAFLKANLIPTLETLPVLESASELLPRTKEEILKRALSLSVVALKGKGLQKIYLDEIIKKFDLHNSFTPKEKEYIDNLNSDINENATFSWRYESLYILFWSLGFINELPIPREPMDIGPSIKLIKDCSLNDLMTKSKPRSSSEILDEADLVYRYHWALVEKKYNKDFPQVELNNDVVMEWHYALNWLIRYMNDSWDNINTDT